MSIDYNDPRFNRVYLGNPSLLGINYIIKEKQTIMCINDENHQTIAYASDKIKPLGLAKTRAFGACDLYAEESESSSRTTGITK